MEFSIGADPEFFLKQGDKHISSIGLIGGSKDKPRPFGKDGFAILEDNVAVEFNIPPAHNHQEFIFNIQEVINKLHQELPQFDFSTESAVVFDQDQLNNPAALEFGCDPDFNAWTKTVNERPCASNMQLRSAGGHVHVGTDQNPIEVIRSMDLFLGVPSTKLDPGKLRRELYGKAGAFRFKDYGCEYRTLSNFWIFSPKLIEWVYNQTEKAVNFVKGGNTINEAHGQLIQDCINNSDENAYATLVRSYNP
jgi:hypothetical protein